MIVRNNSSGEAKGAYTAGGVQQTVSKNKIYDCNITTSDFYCFLIGWKKRKGRVLAAIYENYRYFHTYM